MIWGCKKESSEPEVASDDIPDGPYSTDKDGTPWRVISALNKDHNEVWQLQYWNTAYYGHWSTYTVFDLKGSATRALQTRVTFRPTVIGA